RSGQPGGVTRHTPVAAPATSSGGRIRHSVRVWPATPTWLHLPPPSWPHLPPPSWPGLTRPSPSVGAPPAGPQQREMAGSSPAMTRSCSAMTRRWPAMTRRWSTGEGRPEGVGHDLVVGHDLMVGHDAIRRDTDDMNPNFRRVSDA